MNVPLSVGRWGMVFSHLPGTVCSHLPGTVFSHLPGTVEV